MHEPQLMHEHTCACTHIHMHMHGPPPLWAWSLRLWPSMSVMKGGSSSSWSRGAAWRPPAAMAPRPSNAGPGQEGLPQPQTASCPVPQAPKGAPAVVLDLETPTTPLPEPGLNQPLAPVSAPHAPSEVKLSRAQAGERPPTGNPHRTHPWEPLWPPQGRGRLARGSWGWPRSEHLTLRGTCIPPRPRGPPHT